MNSSIGSCPFLRITSYCAWQQLPGRKCNVENCVWVEFAPLSFWKHVGTTKLYISSLADFWKTCKLDNILFLWPSMNFVQANAESALHMRLKEAGVSHVNFDFAEWHEITFICFACGCHWNMDLNNPPKRIETVRFSSWRFLAQDLPWCASVWTFHLMTVLQVKSRSRPAKGCDPKRSKHTIVKSGATPLGKRITSCWRNQLEATGTTRCWSCCRVSVVTPTTASRARFHPQLWQCFVDQSWPDKELVVVETYHDEPSAFFPAHCARGPAIEIHRDQTSSGWGPHRGAKRNLTIFVGIWSVLCQLRWWWFICQQVCGADGGWDEETVLGGVDAVRLAQFLWISKALQGIRNPTHGIQKIRMKWMRFWRLWF